ncbi:hypothetical protein BGW42_008745 [Actinomortierella wolfii]|nr:hypothetical protein BGW42_008745 [Actinomortierella wolfii]
MPLISSEEIQRFEQYATLTPDPSHTRPLCRQDSMAPLPSPMVNSTQRNRFLPKRRVTLNPGAALSTSALQSVLHPNIHERPPSSPKSEKSKRNRNKTSSMGFVNVSKWASRGGIGQKAEMMLDLETTGIFVPEIGRRLRPEFVYNITTQCADEIRARGLTHPNLFHNPAPKKVINSMISLLTDRQRCDLFSVKCMRIDTVASLLLNTISRMSNPIIPYDMMDYFYSHQFTIVPVSPTQSSSPHGSTTPLSEKQHHQSEESSSSSSTSSHQASMNVTPSSSPRNSLVTPPSSSTNSPVSSSWSYHQPSLHHYQQTVPFTTAWARHYFDLPSFLDNLPAINRSILLEVLHLCQEVLEHASENLVSVASLSEVISPALFSSVFDHKLLDRMAGHKRASIHGDGLSALEGVMQECQMFSAILVRFLVMTSATPTTVSTSPSSSPAMTSSTLAAYNNMPMTCTPMSSASASTTSIPLAVEATSLTLTPTPSIRTNRLSCPNLAMASFPIPVSVAKAKRTSMSPRPSVSEIRAITGIPLFRAEQEAMRAELQEYYQRMEQGFRELDLQRQPLPLSPTAVDLQKLSPISPVCLTNVKDEITAYHQVGDDLPDSNGQGQENQGVFSALILESPFGPKLMKTPVTEQLLAPPPVLALRPSVTNASKESIRPIEVVTAPVV